MEKKSLTLKELKASSYKNFDQIVSDLKNAFMRDFTIERACRYAGLTTETYYVWLKKSDEFKAEMERAQDFLMNKADQVIVNEIVENENVEISKWYKERRDKARFAQKTETDLTSDGEKITGYTFEVVLPKKDE